MIELRGVTHHYGVRPVLRDIDLTIERGSLVAVVGPNGMGKTTLLKLMAGTLSAIYGQVLIDGRRRRATAEDELAIRQITAYLPDHPWVPRNRTGREYLLAAGRTYGIDDLKLFDHVDRLLDLFHLAREGDWPIRGYSNGQKKKIALAATLITDAPILLLDEPFGGGLDPAGILALQHVLKHLGNSDARTVVLTAPAPELVESVADLFLVLGEGQILAFDDLHGLRSKSGLSGSLTEIVGQMIHPETLESVQRYFNERSP